MVSRTLRQAGTAVVAGALALGLAAAPAVARPAVIASDAASVAVTDGIGTVAFGTAAGTVRVIAPDGRAADLAVPPSCRGGDGTGPIVPIVVGNGQIGIGCEVPYDGGTRSEPRLLDVATGRVWAPPGVSELMTRMGFGPPQSQRGWGFTGIGTAALGLSFSGPKWSAEAALDLRTGAELPVPGGQPADAATVQDLDHAAGVQQLCAPLKRLGADWNASWTFVSSAYAKPYLVTADPNGSDLLLQRCGATTRTAIGPGTGWFTIGSGVVSVAPSAGADAYAYLPACGMRLTWAGSMGAAPLRGAVVVTQEAGEAGPLRPGEIRKVPLDGACARATAANRLNVSAGRSRVRAAARSVTFADAPTGAGAVQVERLKTAVPRLRLAAGGRFALATGRAATALRWRAGGAWKAAARAGTGWTARAPHLRAERTVTVRVAYRGGGEGTFQLRALPARR